MTGQHRKSVPAMLARITEELRLLDDLLQSETEIEPAVLHEFRAELDRVRLTAWTIHELMNARRSRRGQHSMEAVIAFLASERLRRLEQMLLTLSADIDHNAISVNICGMDSFSASLSALQERISGKAEALPATEYQSNNTSH